MADDAMDLSNVSLAAAKELCRQGELCIQGTVQLAVATDQRATTLAGILAAAAGALLAAAMALSTRPDHSTELICSAGTAAFLLYLGALLCALAARSTDFHVAGYEPRSLAVCAGDEAWMLRYAAEDIQARISHNRRELEKSSRYYTWGRRVAFVAIPAGLLAFLVCRRLF